MLSESRKIEFQVAMHWAFESLEDSLSVIYLPTPLLYREYTSSNAENGNHKLQSTRPEQSGSMKEGVPFPLPFQLVGRITRGSVKSMERVHGIPTAIFRTPRK
ncbi:hypothetical protein CDAR_375361 [Caerostris darwini]|uniref:Uncharacterized protein n=1 Tax=Caerostris darwini TaxID=1538125 RepID=A0AAV4P9F7_9ARAC|nr:hypothetical protein CDAR_375361 [Caerostris darwini]